MHLYVCCAGSMRETIREPDCLQSRRIKCLKVVSEFQAAYGTGYTGVYHRYISRLDAHLNVKYLLIAWNINLDV